MKRLVIAMLLAGCGTTSSAGDASVVHTATLTSDVFALPGPGLVLADGTTLPEGMGDVWLAQRSVASVYVGAPLGICDVGTFSSLATVPTTLAACTNSAPSDSIVLSSNLNGTNQWVGRSWLVFDDVNRDVPTPIYRARAVSDSDLNPHITLTIEYERL